MIATAEPVSDPPRGVVERLAATAPALLIVAGLIARLVAARSKFLNADEAMHYLLSLQPSFSDTYRASLGTAHPPLLIILLHYWGMISSSEFFLRLPSVIAGDTGIPLTERAQSFLLVPGHPNELAGGKRPRP